MSSFTIKDLLAPITNRFALMYMRVRSRLLDQAAWVERLKGWQHIATAKYFERVAQYDKAAREKQYAAECFAKADEFERQAMFIRADMRFFK